MALQQTGLILSARPNWAESVTERMEWLTDVKRSRKGVEERISLRSLPRFSLRWSPLQKDNDASLLRNLLWRRAHKVMYTPFWPYRMTLDAAATAASNTLSADTTNVPILDDAYVVITDSSQLVSEVRQVTSHTGSQITLTTALDNNWAKGSDVYLASQSYLQNEFSVGVENLTQQAMSSELSVLYQPISPPIVVNSGGAAPASYLGEELWLHEPNWRDGLESEIVQFAGMTDFSLGKISQPDESRGEDASAPERTWKGRWFLNGLAAIADFRAFAYRRMGQYVGFWTPTWLRDFILTQPIGTSDTVIETKTNYAAVVPGMEHIIIMLRNGTYFAREITSVVDNQDGTQDVTISASLGQNVAVADIYRICFLRWCRLGSDSVEFEWQNERFVDAGVSITETAGFEISLSLPAYS